MNRRYMLSFLFVLAFLPTGYAHQHDLHQSATVKELFELSDASTSPFSSVVAAQGLYIAYKDRDGNFAVGFFDFALGTLKSCSMPGTIEAQTFSIEVVAQVPVLFKRTSRGLQATALAIDSCQTMFEQEFSSLFVGKKRNLNRLTNMIADNVIAGAIEGREVEFHKLSPNITEGTLKGFTLSQSKAINVQGDRGGLTVAGDYIALVMGYPGSVNLIDSKTLNLVATASVNGWNLLYVTSYADQLFFGQLLPGGPESQMGTVAVDTLLKHSTGNLALAPVNLPKGFVFQNMASVDKRALVYAKSRQTRENNLILLNLDTQAVEDLLPLESVFKDALVLGGARDRFFVLGVTQNSTVKVLMIELASSR